MDRSVSRVARAANVERRTEPTKFLEASEVARELGLSYSGVYAIIESGGLIPAGVTGRGVRLFLAAEVARLKAFRQARREEREAALVGA